MNFTCCNCGKDIHSVALVFDKQYFLHEACKKEFEAKLKEAESEEELVEVDKE